MKLYEVQATEYNGEQEYSQSKLLAARNINCNASDGNGQIL